MRADKAAADGKTMRFVTPRRGGACPAAELRLSFPARSIPDPVFFQRALKRRAEVKTELVGEHHRHKEYVTQLSRDVALWLVRLLCLGAELVVQLTGKFAYFFGQARQVDQRWKVAFLELADVGIHLGLRGAEIHRRNVPSPDQCDKPALPPNWSTRTLGRMQLEPPRVGIIMGSSSDRPTMDHAARILDELAIPHESEIVSAHRTPDRMFAYAEGAEGRGLQVIIAGAGGAAHLPGMTAAKTVLPVIGVPVQSASLNGLDSLLSIVQMPRGVPVATVAIGNATNAGLLAVRMLALADQRLAAQLADYATEIAEVSAEADEKVNTKKSGLGFR